MKSLSLKVMTLLMAALVLSASGCFNENEMSSPEGTVKANMKALNQKNSKKMLSYINPRERAASNKRFISQLFRDMRVSGIKITDVKTTLVTKKESMVWKGDKWHIVKNENATVEVSAKLNGENIKETQKLVLLDNKWYIERWSDFK